jgi:ribose transport system ATP-binding protein
MADGHASHWGPRRARELGLRAVHQELSLSPHLSVAENLFLGTWPIRSWGTIDRKKLYREAESVIVEIGVRIDPRALVMRLPLGEQQLVELAKTLTVQPRLLILDEATSALDDDQVTAVFRTIRKLCERGTSVVFVSHRLSEVFAISDRIAVLKDGVLVGTRATTGTTHDELVQLMIGRDLQDLFPHKAARSAADRAPLLSVRDLSAGQAFHGVGFDVRAGEIVGLGGLQGQGQKEILRALFGLRKHSGSIFLSGSPAKIGSPQEAMRRGVAYVPEDRKTEGLLVPRSVQFNMSLPSVPVLSRRLLTVNRTREAALAYDLMARLQVKAASVHQTIRRLSGGNQQKVALAKWLAMEPRLYLLDEPTRGIDVGTKREIYALLRKLADSGAAILMTSSDTMELVGLCDTIVVLFEGNVVTVLEGDDVTEENVVRACILAARHEERESA